VGNQRKIDLPINYLPQSRRGDIRLAPSNDRKLPSTFFTISNNLLKWVDHSVNPGEFIHNIGTLGSGPEVEGAGRGRGSTHGSRAIHLFTGIRDIFPVGGV
jgi:hypothetical protein